MLQVKIPIVNVVSTADLDQFIDLEEVNRQRWGRYDQEAYPAGYIRDGDIQGVVSVFHSGKLISAGGKSVSTSFYNLKHAKELLVSVGLIRDVKIRPKLQNMVGSGFLGRQIDLPRFAREVSNTIYEPDQFPGVILHSPGNSTTILTFASGRIVVAGAKSASEINQAGRFVDGIVRKWPTPDDLPTFQRAS